jgi:hypothetical protein
MAYAPKHLSLWKHPSNYAGATWENYYIVIGQHRDSCRLDRSNFTVAKQELDSLFDSLAPSLPDLPDEEQYLVNPYEGHWAVGHVEWIGIHKDSPAELLECADNIKARLENYPILDEHHYSDLEWTEANEYWEHASIRERVRDWIQPAGLPCFAARHSLSEIMHQYDSDRLYEHLTED